LIILLLLGFALLFGCRGNAGKKEGRGGNGMKKQSAGKLLVKKGDIVKVDYIGRLQDGTVFDTNIAYEARKAGLPLRESYDLLEFEVGAGQVIKGFDAAVIGMSEGEEKTFTLAPADAYGERDEALVIPIPLSRIGNAEGIKVGTELQAQNGAIGKVVAIENGTAKVDFNHELAGKTLVFTVRIAAISKK
jgi:FKBP-type peptidyl-prolyl cis-trans isomerase 2